MYKPEPLLDQTQVNKLFDKMVKTLVIELIIDIAGGISKNLAFVRGGTLNNMNVSVLSQLSLLLTQ